MGDDYRKPYVDSSVFIAWLKGENKNGVNRAEVSRWLLKRAEGGEFPITISALTFAEVHKVSGDGVPHLTDEEDDRILAYFEHDFFVVVEVDRTIGEEANRFCRQYKLKPNDAIHLACALRAGCDVLLAWDRPFTSSVKHDRIRAEEPRIIGQIPLPVSSAPVIDAPDAPATIVVEPPPLSPDAGVANAPTPAPLVTEPPEAVPPVEPSAPSPTSK